MRAGLADQRKTAAAAAKERIAARASQTGAKRSTTGKALGVKGKISDTGIRMKLQMQPSGEERMVPDGDEGASAGRAAVKPAGKRMPATGALAALFEKQKQAAAAAAVAAAGATVDLTEELVAEEAVEDVAVQVEADPAVGEDVHRLLQAALLIRDVDDADAGGSGGWGGELLPQPVDGAGVSAVRGVEKRGLEADADGLEARAADDTSRGLERPSTVMTHAGGRKPGGVEQPVAAQRGGVVPTGVRRQGTSAAIGGQSMKVDAVKPRRSGTEGDKL